MFTLGPNISLSLAQFMPKPSFFIDIDGVLYGGNTPVDEGPGVFRYLRRRGFPFLLVTNTSRMTPQQILQKLEGFGYEIALDDIFPVSLAASDFLRSKYGSAKCFLIGDENLAQVLTIGGHVVLHDERPADVVVIGQSQWANFGQIDIARRLVNSGADAVALHRDLTWPDGEVIRIALGPIVAALESVIDKPVTIIGKPEIGFFDAALRYSGFERQSTIMIGDSIQSDILGGMRSGMQTLLVRTGNSSDEKLPASCLTDLDSIASLPDWCESVFPESSLKGD